MDPSSQPIGVFDSGVGGLTVLAALRAELPHESFIYLGDTARLPYGTKSAKTVERYALQIAELLVTRDVKALVVACNTAAGAALPALQVHFAGLPLLGVIEPGADAAIAVTRTGRIAVLATEATVRDGAYQRAITLRRPDAVVSAVACQLLVALAEEGWTCGPLARAAVERYLAPLFGTQQATRPDTLVLGCTHFPMLRAVIGEVVGSQVQMVDSAATAARATRQLLQSRQLLCAAAPAGGITVQLLATDGAARFAATGSRFLGEAIEVARIEIVDI